MIKEIINSITTFFKHLKCRHVHQHSLYCEAVGYNNVIYCVICKDCGKEWTCEG